LPAILSNACYYKSKPCVNSSLQYNIGCFFSLFKVKELHRKLRQFLNDEIGSQDNVFDDLKNMLKAHIPKGIVDKCKNMQDIFDALEKRGHVAIGKYEFLLKIFESINYKNEEVINPVKEYQNKILYLQTSRGKTNTTTGVSSAGMA